LSYSQNGTRFNGGLLNAAAQEWNEPGSPWENSYCESSNSKLWDEFLNGEMFCSIKERRELAERWRIHTTPLDRTPCFDTDRRFRKRG
jgi:Integrase core domain